MNHVSAPQPDDDADLMAGPPCAGNWDEHPLGPAIVTALKTVYDPEIPVNIHDLGLVYRIEIDPSDNVQIDMTLTAPGCPVAEEMPGMLAAAVEPVEGVGQVEVNIVWEPPWTMDRMSEIARIELGFM